MSSLSVRIGENRTDFRVSVLARLVVLGGAVRLTELPGGTCDCVVDVCFVFVAVLLGAVARLGAVGLGTRADATDIRVGSASDDGSAVVIAEVDDCVV